MHLNDFLNHPGSTTKIFKNLATKSQVEILWDGFINDHIFERVVLIKLDNVPVMVAVSSTNINSPLFLEILKNSGIIPIGVRLFDPKAHIRRSKMNFSEVLLDDITHQLVKNELKQRLQDKLIIERNSIFKHGLEEMQLREYILPGLEQLLDRALHLG